MPLGGGSLVDLPVAYVPIDIGKFVMQTPVMQALLELQS